MTGGAEGVEGAAARLHIVDFERNILHAAGVATVSFRLKREHCDIHEGVVDRRCSAASTQEGRSE